VTVAPDTPRARGGDGQPAAETVLLSILVPTVPGRESKLARLLASLDAQTHGRHDVELLVLRDSRSLTIGEKRNKMVQIARGEYVAFVDDDDAVAADYVETICKSLLQAAPDVLCFTVAVMGHGPEKPCRFHPSFGHENLAHEYRRKPNHLMVWRRELAAAIPFPHVRRHEDDAWAERMATVASRVTTVERVLYTYQFDPRDNSRIPPARRRPKDRASTAGRMLGRARK
jgi:hypothetical protein